MNLISSRKFDSADSWDMEIVLNASKTEITTQEKTVLVSKQGENVQDRYFREPDTGSTLLSHQEKLPISCLFYKKPHKSQNCRIVSGTRTRKNIVRTSKRCFVCLKGSHHAKVCFSKIKCFKCSEQHQRQSEENGHGSNGSSAANIVGVDNNTNILLQTAKVKVKNCDNSSVNSGRVSFNSYSQLSYITPQLRLKSKIVGIRKISNIQKKLFRKYFRKIKFMYFSIRWVTNLCHLLCKKKFCTAEQSKY